MYLMGVEEILIVLINSADKQRWTPLTSEGMLTHTR